MRIGMMIGQLSRGGAERQLVSLASGLAERKHHVEVLCYTGASELDELLVASGVSVRLGGGRSYLDKIALSRKWLIDFQPDVVHGFMKRASTLAVVSSLGIENIKVLVTDMSTATYGRHKPSLWAALTIFGWADQIVTQTERNRASLELLAPWLRGRVRVIRNGVDPILFSPPVMRDRHDGFRFCAVGTVYAIKNPVKVVEAVALLSKRRVPTFQVNWYGRLGIPGDPKSAAVYQEALSLSEELGVSQLIRFHGESKDILRVYHGADAILHASVQEGFPNAVVEAMACGLPIAVGNVSDLPLVVKEADNGYLFDQFSATSIADGMERMIATPMERRAEMGKRSRELAVRWFSQERFIRDFEDAYRKMIFPKGASDA